MTHGIFSDLPEWKSHKVVRAAKIVEIDERDGGACVLKLEGGAELGALAFWRGKHEPHVGGYFVVYEDGYTSYSPAAAFEGGYTRIAQGATA